VSLWLDATRMAEDIKPQRIYEIIDLLDTAAKSHQRKLAMEYVGGGNRLQRFKEQRIWSTIVEFSGQLGAAYEFCLAQTVLGVPGYGALKPLLPTLTCRALRALTLELKWALMRYGPVDPTLWGRSAALYSKAEQDGFVLELCTVYPGPWSDSSVQREYLKALMLSMSATDSLLPRKLELAERIVADFSGYFVLQKQLAKGCHYHVDLSVARSPARLVERVTTLPTMRYFGPGAASDVVEKVIDTITETGAIPSNLTSGATTSPAS